MITVYFTTIYNLKFQNIGAYWYENSESIIVLRDHAHRSFFENLSVKLKWKIPHSFFKFSIATVS